MATGGLAQHGAPEGQSYTQSWRQEVPSLRLDLCLGKEERSQARSSAHSPAPSLSLWPAHSVPSSKSAFCLNSRHMFKCTLSGKPQKYLTKPADGIVPAAARD